MSRAISMKQWLQEEAERLGVTADVIAKRVSRGKYPNLQTKRVNKRVVFVLQND